MTKNTLSSTMQKMKITSAEFKKGIKGTDEILTEPKLQVAFIGRSNVGKSSLMNLLLNRKDLVKSGKVPGKTLELNFFLINKSFYFVDLPGYGYAKMSVDMRNQLAKMIQWYLFEIEIPDRKVVLVLDAKVGLSEMDLEMFRLLRESKHAVIVVANKIDLLNQSKRSSQLKTISNLMPGTPIIPCSTKTKEGREEILKKLSE
ncbi:MAG: ribosome biogenesis GTP-binding protein YihA/YsxC [Candidatus Pacebacteria bacterium]|nr:ribosome biogenesis GTP-binding protein YihA/YsxC [Candidatus Paceibacterota bacterium]